MLPEHPDTYLKTNNAWIVMIYLLTNEVSSPVPIQQFFWNFVQIWMV